MSETGSGCKAWFFLLDDGVSVPTLTKVVIGQSRDDVAVPDRPAGALQRNALQLTLKPPESGDPVANFVEMGARNPVDLGAITADRRQGADDPLL